MANQNAKNQEAKNRKAESQDGLNDSADAGRLTDEEIQKSKRDYGLGIFGSKTGVSVRLLDRLIIGLILLVIICLFWFSRTPGYRVHFETNGAETAVEDQKVLYGEFIQEPAKPHKPGYVFQGWYLSNGYEWDFDTDTVSSEMTLTAEFELDPSILDSIEAGIAEEP